MDGLDRAFLNPAVQHEPGIFAGGWTVTLCDSDGVYHGSFGIQRYVRKCREFDRKKKRWIWTEKIVSKYWYRAPSVL